MISFWNSSPTRTESGGIFDLDDEFFCFVFFIFNGHFSRVAEWWRGGSGHLPGVSNQMLLVFHSACVRCGFRVYSKTNPNFECEYISIVDIIYILLCTRK